MELRKVTRLSMFLALAVVLNIVENVIPIFQGVVPGVKLGLTNIVILFVLYKYGFREALSLSITRVILVGVLNTGLFSVAFFLSLSGALFSIIMMGLVKKLTKLSIVGVSVIGSLFHSLGQIIVVAIILYSVTAFNYLPILILFSIPTGILTGVLCKELLKYFE